MNNKVFIFLLIFFVLLFPYNIIKSNTISISFEKPLNGLVLRNPVIDDMGNIYLLTNEGTFYAFKKDGTEIFNLSISKMKQRPCVYSDLILSNDGIIYFTITNLEKLNNNYDQDIFKSYCYSIDTLNKKVKKYWELKYDNPKATYSPSISDQINERLPKASAIDKDDTVYFGSYDSKIFSFSVNNNINAAFRVNSTGKFYSLAISCLKNNQTLVYITNDLISGSNYYLHSRSLEGALLFTTEPISSPNPFYDRISDMVIDGNGLIYFICSSMLPESNQGYAFIDSYLYVFDSLSPLTEIGNDSFLPMKPKKVIPIQGFAKSSSLIIGSNNEVFISGNDGLFSFDLKNNVRQIYKCKNIFTPVLDKENNLYLSIDSNNDNEVDTLTCISNKGNLLWEYPINLQTGPVISINTLTPHNFRHKNL